MAKYELATLAMERDGEYFCVTLTLRETKKTHRTVAISAFNVPDDIFVRESIRDALYSVGQAAETLGGRTSEELLMARISALYQAANECGAVVDAAPIGKEFGTVCSGDVFGILSRDEKDGEI